MALLNVAGYMFTYYNSKVNKEREEQIDRVNAQVETSMQRKHPFGYSYAFVLICQT